jgi:membrane protein
VAVSGAAAGEGADGVPIRGARFGDLVRDLIGALRGHDLALYAAGLTFYAAIAVVPLVLVTIFGAGLLLGPEQVRRVGVELAQYVPAQLGLREALRWTAEVAPRLSWTALLAALIPATTYGEGLARALARLAGTPARAPGLIGRLKSLLILPAAPLVVALGLLAAAALPELLGFGRRALLVGVYATFWIGWVATTVLLSILYRAFSGRPLGPWALFWGTAATGSFLTGMTLGWVLLLEFGVSVGRAYGGSTAIGTAVLATLYLFLVQIVLLSGYIVTVRLQMRRDVRTRRPPSPASSPPAPPRSQGATPSV